MKRQFAIGVMLVTLAWLAGAARADATWKDYPSKDGKWTVKFPDTPKEETQPVPTEVGTLEEKLWMVTTSANVAYAAGYVDYPKEIPKDRVQAMLDGARDGMVKNVNGKLNSETKISLPGGFPGREASVSIQGGITLQVRTFLVNSRLYQLMVISGGTADVKGFFESFKVIKP